jgi:hypothetical protein
MEFLSHTQHSNFSFCGCNLLSPLSSTNTAQVAYLIPSLLSPLVPPPSAFNSIFDVENGGIPVVIVTTTGVFSCLVELQPGADNVYDVRLGRDWFSYCTTAVPHAQILLSDGMCLTFSSSPLLAVRPRHTDEFL